MLPLVMVKIDPGSVLPHPAGAGRQLGPSRNLMPVKSRPLNTGAKPCSVTAIFMVFIAVVSPVSGRGPAGNPFILSRKARMSTLSIGLTLVASYEGMVSRMRR